MPLLEDKLVSLADLKEAYDNTVHGIKGSAESGDYRSGDVIITPANIGALPLSGGTMTGNINFGSATATSGAKRATWTTADGSTFYITPYDNLFQIVRTPPSGSAINVLGFNTNGTVSLTNNTSWRSALDVYSKSESAALIASALYSVRGIIVKSASSGEAQGYGKASIWVIGKNVIIDFEAKITTAGTKSDIYDIGMQVSTLRSLNANIPNMTVLHGGNIHYYNSNGTLDTSMEGYAAEATFDATRNCWVFARIYNTSGNIGAWNDNKYTLDKIIMGTLFASVN